MIFEIDPTLDYLCDNLAEANVNYNYDVDYLPGKAIVSAVYLVEDDIKYNSRLRCLIDTFRTPHFIIWSDQELGRARLQRGRMSIFRKQD